MVNINILNTWIDWIIQIVWNYSYLLLISRSLLEQGVLVGESGISISSTIWSEHLVKCHLYTSLLYIIIHHYYTYKTTYEENCKKSTYNMEQWLPLKAIINQIIRIPNSNQVYIYIIIFMDKYF